MSSPSPPATEPPPAVRALFQRRVDGDDALLELARLRFDQAGLAAEVYADTPEELEWVLGFAPQRPHLPVVHLSRRVNLLEERGRALVETFASRFGGRVAGLVVHDKTAMGQRTGDLVAGLTDLGARLERQSDGPMLFLEYAAGLELDWFVDVAERLRGVPRVGACVDVGHVGIAQARASFSGHRPGLELAALRPDDPRLPELAADVQAAVASALPAVLWLVRALGQVPVHVVAHDPFLGEAQPVVPVWLAEQHVRVPAQDVHRELAGQRVDQQRMLRDREDMRAGGLSVPARHAGEPGGRRPRGRSGRERSRGARTRPRLRA